jgi:hypothetical protein
MLLIALLTVAQSLSVRPTSLTLHPGQRTTLRINEQPTKIEASDPHTILELAPNGHVLSVQAPPYSKDLSILIRSRDEFVVVPVQVVEPPPPARLVIGLSQSGASSAQASLHYFFDFFANRPLRKNVTLWGNVRIASAPRQIDVPVAQFAPDFLKSLGQVRVNELALSGEFLTGVEFHTSGTLGFVAFFGASNSFSDPVARTRVFKTAPNQYLGLIPQDRERFYRQYGVGIRHSSAETGTLTATLGQDQSVTGGRYRGAVFRVDTFYPLKTTGFYFFATAAMAVAKPDRAMPLSAYEPAPDVPAFDPRVTLRTSAAARDSYRIGFGIDLLRVLHSR